jgi:DNA invertase Pin-like site-specific DNA recombinase
MKIGYARVSTDDQNLALQLDALGAAGCERFFEDKESGAKASRPGLDNALDFARPGDTLVVWRLDRLGRSLTDLVRVINDLEEKGIGFESITEKIETSTASGRLVFHLFAALSEFERNIIRERTKAGLKSARSRGRSGGRPGVDPEKIKAIRKLAADPQNKPGDICKALSISRATFYKYASKS